MFVLSCSRLSNLKKATPTQPAKKLGPQGDDVILAAADENGVMQLDFEDLTSEELETAVSQASLSIPKPREPEEPTNGQNPDKENVCPAARLLMVPRKLQLVTQRRFSSILKERAPWFPGTVRLGAASHLLTAHVIFFEIPVWPTI